MVYFAHVIIVEYTRHETIQPHIVGRFFARLLLISLYSPHSYQHFRSIHKYIVHNAVRMSGALFSHIESERERQLVGNIY